jgi:hypothetical protein
MIVYYCKISIIIFPSTTNVQGGGWKNDNTDLTVVNNHPCTLVVDGKMIILQHNGQKKKYKRTNNDLQNIHIKQQIE